MCKTGITLAIVLFVLCAPPLSAHAPAAEGCGASAAEYAHELAIMSSATQSSAAASGLPARHVFVGLAITAVPATPR